VLATLALIFSTVDPVEPAHVSDPVSDGKHILTGMLITGLIFLAVIGIGELSRWAGHRRQARRRGAGAY
jgi:hypothetical protein